MSTDITNEGIAARLMYARLTKMSARLRTLADAVDSHANTITRTTGPHRPYSRVASDVQGEILWAVANLNLAELTNDAAEADAMSRDG